MLLPFQKLKKNILWKGIETETIDIFFPLYKQFTLFLLARYQFICCKEEVVATHV